MLRRTREPGDYLAPARYLSFNQEVFVRYIRRTQVIAGNTYYVIPAILTTCKSGPAYWGITFKVVAASGWFAARPSGTENVYKIYAESFKDQTHLDAIVSEAQQMVNNALTGN